LSVSEMQISTNKPFFDEFDFVKEIITKLIDENKKAIEDKGLKLNFFSTLPEAVIVGDQNSIYQIFVNLLGNAVKYTKTGDISIYISKNEQGIEVSMEDTGIGISEEFMEAMFHPLNQDEGGDANKYEGNRLGFTLVKKYCDLNGIGLSLIKKYCDLNKIAMTLISKKDAGTKFTLVFTRTK